MKTGGTRKELSSIRFSNTIIKLRDKDIYVSYEYFKQGEFLYLSLLDFSEVSHYNTESEFFPNPYEFDYFEEKLADKLLT